LKQLSDGEVLMASQEAFGSRFVGL